jgi:dienelactone hydrolase
MKSVGKVTVEPEGELSSVLAAAQFEKTSLTVKIVFDAHDEIVGLFFLPPEVPWTAPAYANESTTEESAVQVGTTPALPGTLTMPRQGPSLPAVILVHGSGPNDRDESVGGVKVFKDLALGLAARGVAVLRYEKRSRQSPSGIETEKEEVFDGAHDAIELLRRRPRVDPKRIFVLGHSQGAGLAPRIAKANPGVAGMIVLAGPTRSVGDGVIDQLSHLATIHPDDAELRKKIEQAREFKRRVEDPNLQPGDDVHFPTGGVIPGAYFLFQRGYDPVATARSLGLPIFVLQGERDYQVTMKDLDGWKKGLLGARFATIKTYAGLNHLFVHGTGTPRPEEYEAPGHVDQNVVTDIASWIAKTPGR